MAQTAASVRRVPALLTVLATVVVLIAALAAVGVIESPSPAAASLASTVGGGADSASAMEGGTSADPGGSAIDSDAANGDPVDGELGGADQGTLAGEQFIAATTGAFGAMAQPAADAASPEPVDTAKVPAAPEAGDAEALPAESGKGRRVVYSINGQRVWLVENDERVSRTYRVSGRLDRPGPGSYEVYSKSPTAISYDYTETMQHMIRFAHGESAAIGFHDIPVLDDGTPVQTEAQLGQPLSAGCVRQSQQDAEWLWNWAVLGTTVVVVA